MALFCSPTRWRPPLPTICSSATAPLTALAKKHGFRGATLHGLNDIIIESGLSVDYREVSADAEKLRLATTRADEIEIDFVIEGGQQVTCSLDLGGQEAQKSHGLCLGTAPDIANLPAGEVYFVPAGAEGQFPMLYEDGTIGIMSVSDGRIQAAELLQGDQTTIDAHNAKVTRDPVTGEIGELGFGTQVLPVSGRDIQDEKILGTVHVATGRSDHPNQVNNVLCFPFIFRGALDVGATEINDAMQIAWNSRRVHPLQNHSTCSIGAFHLQDGTNP